MEDESAPAPVAKVTQQQKESEKRIKSLRDGVFANPISTDNEDEEEDKEVSNYGAMSEPLEAAFASNELAAQLHQTQREEAASERGLFTGLVFFLSREVPAGCLELVLRAHGAQIGWEGEGSPFTEKSERITHHLMDRPHQGHRYFNREYVQPQWVFDSINNGILLPMARYVPGAELPPHLSPFVEDSAEGYVPEYRKQLDKLKSASQVLREVGAIGEEGDEEMVAADESEDEEEAYVAGIKAEREGHSTSADKSDDSDKDDEDDEDDEEEEPQPAATKTKKSSKEKKEEEDAELKELAKSMMSKKAKRLYDRMHYGLGKKADKVEALEAKRARIEEEKAAAAKEPTAKAGGDKGQPSKKKRKKASN